MDVETANKKMTYSPTEGIWRDKHWIKHYLHEACSVCGKPFVGKKYNKRCSRKCFLVDDNPMFKDSNKKAMSARFMGDNNHMKKPEIVAKISGENCYMWAGGVSNAPYPWDFNHQLKESIRERDGRKCCCCGNADGPLDVHHIDYDKDNIADSNLITLCHSCHSRTNFNRDIWREKFAAIQT
jgi:HNH endonuclease.